MDIHQTFNSFYNDSFGENLLLEHLHTGTAYIHFIGYQIDQSNVSPPITYNVISDLSPPSTYVYNVSVSDDAQDFVFDGHPSMSEFQIGDTIEFTRSDNGHPFVIQNDAYEPITNTISFIGESIQWIPSQVGTYYYQCTTHSTMNGTILVNNPTMNTNIPTSLFIGDTVVFVSTFDFVIDSLQQPIEW